MKFVPVCPSLHGTWGQLTLAGTGGSDSPGEGGGGGSAEVAGSVFSLKMDFSFLMLWVGARPLSLVKLKLEKTIVE